LTFSESIIFFIQYADRTPEKLKKKLLKGVLEWQQLIDIKMACENTRQIANLLFFWRES
jgi:hypothetical protein